MNSKKFSKYSKKYQEQILGYINWESKKVNVFTYDYVLKEIERIFKLIPMVEEKINNEAEPEWRERKLQWMLSVWLSSIRGALADYIYYERIANDNLKVYLDGLYTIQRLGLIIALQQNYNKPYNSDAIIKFRYSLAYFDKQLIDACLTYISGPFKFGHSFNISLGNGMYMLLRNKNKNDVSNYMEKRLQLKILTKYDKNILRNIQSIANKDEKTFLETLNYVLNNHTKQEISLLLGLGVYLGIEALGYYNLAEHVWGEKPPEPKDNEFWDREFIEYSNNHQPEFVIDFSQFSDTLVDWLNNLPAEHDVRQLIRDY